MENTSDINVEQSLGKGEVVSSILTGSTTKAADNRHFSHSPELQDDTQSREQTQNRASQSVQNPWPTDTIRSALAAYLDWYAAHEPELSTVAGLQATYCKLHAEMMLLNGGECPAPLLAQVQADFHKLESLRRQSVSEETGLLRPNATPAEAVVAARSGVAARRDGQSVSEESETGSLR